jgi:hypothetical protein
MRNLLLSSVLLVLLAGCHFGHYGRLTEKKFPPDVCPTSIFGDHFNSFLFKTNMTVYGHDFSGLLVTKQMEPQDYRVIFTTELGMKLFDFEFKDTAFTLHYCVPQFNKPKLLKVIQQDIQILLMNDMHKKTFNSFEDPKTQSAVFKADEGKFSNYYFLNESTKYLTKIEHAKNRRKKIIFTLNKFENNFPTNVMIQHCDIKLKIELNLLKK